jgi:hypothetical protein
MQRLELGGREADPVRQGRAIELHALPRKHLRLPVQRKMVGVFGFENIGD